MDSQGTIVINTATALKPDSVTVGVAARKPVEVRRETENSGDDEAAADHLKRLREGPVVCPQFHAVEQYRQSDRHRAGQQVRCRRFVLNHASMRGTER